MPACVPDAWDVPAEAGGQPGGAWPAQSSSRGGDVGSMTAGFARGMNFSGAEGGYSAPPRIAGGQQNGGVAHLDQFLKDRIEKPDDRGVLLRFEADMAGLLRDQTAHRLQYPPMSSYQRMVVHKVG